jgi:hypothetical protein
MFAEARPYVDMLSGGLRDEGNYDVSLDHFFSPTKR